MCRCTNSVIDRSPALEMPMRVHASSGSSAHALSRAEKLSANRRRRSSAGSSDHAITSASAADCPSGYCKRTSPAHAPANTSTCERLLCARCARTRARDHPGKRLGSRMARPSNPVAALRTSAWPAIAASMCSAGRMPESKPHIQGPAGRQVVRYSNRFLAETLGVVAMDVVNETVEKGVVERRFDLKAGNEVVPGILWLPEKMDGPRPTILIGHGGTQHKRVPNVLGLARRFVRHLGFAAVAIDAPGHGDRVTDPAAATEARQRLESRIQAGASGEGRRGLDLSPQQAKEWVARTARGVTEWKA